MKLVIIFIAIFLPFECRILNLHKPARKLPVKMYVMDAIEKMEQTKYLLGKPNKGNRAKTMKGGLLNVELGNEGAPIYIDQSPSYIYRDPRTPFNQNGVRLPMPDQNNLYRNNRPQILESNFMKPVNYDPTQKIYLPGVDEPNNLERRLKNFRVRTIVPRDRNYLNVVKPEGAVIRTRFRDASPDDMEYYVQGADEFSKLDKDQDAEMIANNLVDKIDRELQDFKSQMNQKDDEIENLLTRIYDLRVT